ncbi:MAG: hypothetical protein SH818_11095 [Saprospiraceae bacterium]|nr:hypothetical protein [Saprospiraceae bacterium]
MNKIILLSLISILVMCGCERCFNHAEMRRHINVNLDDMKAFDQSGEIKKEFIFDSKDFINAVTDNIDAKDATIENMQIETLQLSVSLAANNTATSLNNLHFKLGQGWGAEGASLLKHDLPFTFVNWATVKVANEFMIFRGVEQVKNGWAKAIASKGVQQFKLEMSAIVPAGTTFRGSIKLILVASMDAVTCELVPYGLGPSECMIIPIHLTLSY